MSCVLKISRVNVELILRSREKDLTIYVLQTNILKHVWFKVNRIYRFLSPLGAGLLSTGSPGFSHSPPGMLSASFCFSLSSISDATSCFLRLLLGNWKAGTRL